jgi:hypothetical protein
MTCIHRIEVDQARVYTHGARRKIKKGKVAFLSSPRPGQCVTPSHCAWPGPGTIDRCPASDNVPRFTWACASVGMATPVHQASSGGRRTRYS